LKGKDRIRNARSWVVSLVYAEDQLPVSRELGCHGSR